MEVHRSQAHALAIRARAEMRLAEEYDAAQERGEVATRADQNLLPSEKKVSAADIGLSHKDVHEARKLRDADAAALASYARQSEDLELEKMAARIRARAMRRAGELLKQIEPQRGARTDLQPTDGGDSKLMRREVAKQAGMSERQQVTAVRVASIPEPEFAAQVESANPPTLTELA